MSTVHASSTHPTAEPLPRRRVELVGPEGDRVPAQVAEVGAGRRFVFLHGLVGLNEHWEEVARRVSHRVRCVLLEIPLLDLRGDDCSIDGVTDLTSRFLENEYHEPSVLVGNSFGGHVALRTAIEHPDLVQGLVLAGSSGLIEKSMVREVQIRPSREWLAEKIGELFYDRAKMSERDLDRAHRELSARGGARAMVRLSRTARRNHLGERIREIRVPVSLIWGREDIVTPPEAAHEFMELLPDARLTWFEHCGHAPMIECPDLFAQALLDFADELERREA